MWARTQGSDWVVTRWPLAIGCLSGDNADVVVVVVSHGVGHPHRLTLVSGRGLAIGACVGVWALDRAGAHPLTHYGDRDNNPVVVSHGGGRPRPWACRLAPVLRRWGCGWMWAGARVRCG